MKLNYLIIKQKRIQLIFFATSVIAPYFSYINSVRQLSKSKKKLQENIYKGYELSV